MLNVLFPPFVSYNLHLFLCQCYTIYVCTLYSSQVIRQSFELLKQRIAEGGAKAARKALASMIANSPEAKTHPHGAQSSPTATTAATTTTATATTTIEPMTLPPQVASTAPSNTN